jgi:hypothetical protein
MTTFQTVASEFYAAFERATRTESKVDYFRFRDDAPAWIKESKIAFKAHCAVDDTSDPRWPDDWVFASMRAIASHVTDSEYATSDDARDHAFEIAQACCDDSTPALIAWLASNAVRNTTLCDDARAEGLVTDDAPMSDRIRSGQYTALQRLTWAVLSAIGEESESREWDIAHEDAETQRHIP